MKNIESGNKENRLLDTAFKLFTEKGIKNTSIQEIVDARAQGDLSENAEYEAAREKQGLIEDRIAEIEKTLENAQEIKTSKKDIISIGSVVTIKNKFSNQKETYSIVST